MVIAETPYDGTRWRKRRIYIYIILLYEGASKNVEMLVVGLNERGAEWIYLPGNFSCQDTLHMYVKVV